MRILCVIVAILSSQAFALFDAQLLVGPRRSNFKVDDTSQTVSGTEIQLSAHLDPIPLVPVSFGAYYGMVNYKPDADGEVFGGVDTMTGGEFGLEVSAWLKLPVFDLIPYGKLGYTLWGANAIVDDAISVGSGRTAKYESLYSSKGPKMTVGLKWSPLAIVSALVEVNYHQQTWTYEEAKLAGNKIDNDDASDINNKATSILIGVEAGL